MVVRSFLKTLRVSLLPLQVFHRLSQSNSIQICPGVEDSASMVFTRVCWVGRRSNSCVECPGILHSFALRAGNKSYWLKSYISDTNPDSSLDRIKLIHSLLEVLPSASERYKKNPHARAPQGSLWLKIQDQDGMTGGSERGGLNTISLLLSRSKGYFKAIHSKSSFWICRVVG